MTPLNPQVSSTCSNWVGSFIMARLSGFEPLAFRLGNMFVELPAMSSHKFRAVQNIVVFVQNILMQQRNYTPRKSFLQNHTGNGGNVKQSGNHYIRIKYNIVFHGYAPFRAFLDARSARDAAISALISSSDISAVPFCCAASLRLCTARIARSALYSCLGSVMEKGTPFTTTERFKNIRIAVGRSMPSSS